MGKTREFKFTPLLGDLPEGGATDWWTKKDWEEHERYVEKLKAEGKYLTKGEEYTFIFPENSLYDVEVSDNPNMFSNFGILMPNTGIEAKQLKTIIKNGNL